MKGTCRAVGYALTVAAMRFSTLCFVVLAGLLAGCSSITPKPTLPTVDLGKYRHIYVRSAANDNAQLDVLMANELRALGYDATNGVRTMQPDNTELTLTYDSHWEWDFRQYLIEIRLYVSDARTEQLMTTARIFHPGITQRSPAERVHDVIGQLFLPATKNAATDSRGAK